MKSFNEYLTEAPYTLRGNAKVHFVTQESKNGKFAKVACGMKAGNKVFTGTQEGKEVTKGSVIAEWDPYTIPILTEAGGTVKFGDLEEGKTMKEQKIIAACKVKPQ